MKYLPEGSMLNSEENLACHGSLLTLHEAMALGKILEARAVVCESNHDLTVDLGSIRGIIPREEAALGISEGTTRDIAIITRVGKPVCFKVIGFHKLPSGKTQAVLSRRLAQQECLEEFIRKLRPGDIIPAKVTHLEQFGAFVDIGCGIVSMIPIDAISVSRIAHPKDRFRVGQNIRVIIRAIEGDRVLLSHKELLGSWEENAAQFHIGETVSGIVRSVEDYGIFIELTPNLAGLAELREEVRPGQTASVYIKNIIPEKMKVKLIIIDAFDAAKPSTALHYFTSGPRIDRWLYSPHSSDRLIETVFE